MKRSKGPELSTRQARREFLHQGPAARLPPPRFGAIPLRGWAADPVNIGALYPVTGSMAQIGQGCVAAAKLAVEMVNEAGGIKSLGGAKLNLIVSDVQSDTTVTRTETDRLISGNKLSGDSRLLCQRAHFDRQRSGGTRQGADHHRLELRSAQQGPYTTRSRRSRALRSSPRRSCKCRSSSATSRRLR